MSPAAAEDPFIALGRALGRLGAAGEQERRALIAQALLHLEELRDLYLTERARAEELAAANRRLEAGSQQVVSAEQSREEFLTNCSHELRTPLTPIIGWAKTLKTRRFSPEEVRQFAEVIERNGMRLLRIVDSLLRMASIHRNYKRTLRMSPVDVGRLLERAARPAHAVDRRVEVRVAAGAEVAVIHESYLSEALLILVDNALKFSPEESPLHLVADRQEEELILSVADEGPGVPEPDRERIFEPFARIESSPPHPIPGLGTGLYICRRLVEAHGGRIWVEDAPGGGANFVLTIPQRRLHPADRAEAGAQADP